MNLRKHIISTLLIVFSLVVIGNVYGGSKYYVDNSGDIFARSVAYTDGARVDVKAYGATGDGVTDDIVAIQNALAALPTSGGTVIIPPGTYKISSSISLPNGVRLLGEGWPTIYQSAPNLGGLVPGNDCEIAFIKFKGTGNLNVLGRGMIENDPNGTGLIGQRVDIHDNYFDSSISTTDIGGNNFIDSRIYNNVINAGIQSEHGIYISGGSKNTWVYNNRITRTGTPAGTSVRGIQIKGSSYLYVLNNTVTGPWNGYGITASEVSNNNVYIRGNSVYSLASGADGIAIGGNSSDSQMFVEDNYISNVDVGIKATSNASGANNFHIDGNKVVSTVFQGIIVDASIGSISKVFINGNTVTNPGGDAINATSVASDLYILENMVTGSSTGGISLNTGTPTGLVAYNTSLGFTSPILGNGTTPIFGNQTGSTAANFPTIGSYSSSGVLQNTVHIVQDTVTLSSGTATVTLTGNAVFTSATSYTCVAIDDFRLNIVYVVQNSGSSITFNGNTTDPLRYICIGN